MNGIAFTPKTGKNPAAITPWDGEIKNLYTNFYLLELILCQPAGLSAQAVLRYRRLHRLLIETMEHFLLELDTIEAGNSAHKSRSRTVLRKHAVVMRELNTAVDRLVMEYKPQSCS